MLLSHALFFPSFPQPVCKRYGDRKTHKIQTSMHAAATGLPQPRITSQQERRQQSMKPNTLVGRRKKEKKATISRRPSSHFTEQKAEGKKKKKIQRKTS